MQNNLCVKSQNKEGSGFFLPKMPKIPTYLTGIPCSENAERLLKFQYKKLLKLLSKFPKDCQYKINTEDIISHRLAAAEEAGEDRREIEDNICSGNLELLVLQARNECDLARCMLLWKPWEKLKDSPPPEQWVWPPVIP